MVLCEVCVEGIQGAVAAARGGAHRIELCAGLVEGGTTPSQGTVAAVLEGLAVDTVVLVRPRGGDFLYDAEEMEVLLRDIRWLREVGVHGIATGVLYPQGTVDRTAVERIREAAGPLSFTFHRAFDMTRDLLEALDTLIGLGVDRVLTSGGKASVMDALPTLRGLVETAGDQISVMPGGGIREENLERVVRETGTREVHFTATARWESGMAFRNPVPRMGSDSVPEEYERVGTDMEKVRRMVRKTQGTGSSSQSRRTEAP